MGCKKFFARCGGPERTHRHQRVKESEAEGYIVLRKRLGTPAGLRWGAHTELSTRKKKEPILNDMGQLHYMLTESVIRILCQICYWTSVGPLCERIEEL